MFDMFLGTAGAWRIITHLGSASLLLPTLALTATGLGLSGQTRAMRIWLLALGLAIVTTTVTKILFFGWGIGSASFNFTGISGHALLATAILPVLFGWLLASDKSRLPLIGGVLLGLLLSVLVGLSRIILGAHSLSEVVSAWVIGVAVSTCALAALQGANRRPRMAFIAPLVLLLAFSTATSNYLPTHDWEISLAVLMSGHGKPYTRHQLLLEKQSARNATNPPSSLAQDKPNRHPVGLSGAYHA